MELFNLNLSAGFLKSSLEGLGLCLGNLLFHRGGSTVNEILRFLQTETELSLHDLDHIELSLSGILEDDVELGLLGLSGAGGTTFSSDDHSGGCRLDTLLFLEDLCKFLNVFYRKVHQLFCKGFNICHNFILFNG